MTIYCSYTDSLYLTRILALLESMRPWAQGDVFRVLALDQNTEEFFLHNPIECVEVVTLDQIQYEFPELVEARQSRTAIEFVFTLTPFLVKHCLRRTIDEDLVAYLDADLYFFDSPRKVLDEIGSAPISIIPHHYNLRSAQRLRKYGKYNVGWVGIRNSQTGRDCVNWWASQCLDWCGDEPLDGKYADQGYLDQFPNLFEGVKVLENRGFNLAPWNTKGQAILKDSDGQVTLGDHTPLTFFHFHGLKRFGKWMVTSQLNYRSPASKSLVEHVYKPYLRALQAAEKELENSKPGRPTQQLVRGKGLRKWARNLLGKLLMIASVLTGNAVDMSRLK